jgi:hypothetical protein
LVLLQSSQATEHYLTFISITMKKNYSIVFFFLNNLLFCIHLFSSHGKVCVLFMVSLSVDKKALPLYFPHTASVFVHSCFCVRVCVYVYLELKKYNMFISSYNHSHFGVIIIIIYDKIIKCTIKLYGSVLFGIQMKS